MNELSKRGRRRIRRKKMSKRTERKKRGKKVGMKEGRIRIRKDIDKRGETYAILYL